MPKTQGIKYAGSKLKLLPQILSLVDDLDVKTVFDGFSGSTRVSQAFAQLGYQVTASDISEWSYILGICYLQNKKDPSYYQDLIDHLNSLEGYEGWFTENYGGRVGENEDATQTDGTKKPWQIHNTKKLDAIRTEIDRLNLSKVERAVALTSLILAMDEVDNTMGHYASYLRKWSQRSYKKLRLKVPQLFINAQENRVIKGNIFDVVENIQADFAYLDPPYGSNNEKMPPSRVRYASYYHIWTTIIKNDRPQLFGKVGRRRDTSDPQAASVFEEFRKDEEGRYLAVKALDQLMEKVNARYIALSYSSGGRATADQLNQVLSSHGKIRKTLKIDYKKNVMAGMTWTHEWTKDAQKENQEFIFLIEK